MVMYADYNPPLLGPLSQVVQVLRRVLPLFVLLLLTDALAGVTATCHQV